MNYSNNTSPSSAFSPNNIFSIISSIFTTFSIIVLGYGMGKYKCIPKTVGVGLGTFLFQVALPALIFHSCGTMSFVGVNWWILVALFLGKALIFCCTIIIGTLSTGLETAAVWAIFVTQSNDFALGLPLLRSLYSTTHPNYPTYIFLAAPISLVILNPIGFVCMELGTLKRRNPQQRQNESNESNESKLSSFP